MKFKSRLIKTKEEIALMKRAVEISSDLHLAAMKKLKSGVSELQINDSLEKLKGKTKATGWAYETIVGSGWRSTILHAKPTKRLLKIGELCLIDMGVQYQGWCSDITRTWPVSGKFSTEQAQIYDIVWQAQQEVLKHIAPKRTLNELHEVAKESLKEGLLRAKLLHPGEDIQTYYPHKTSHWIGSQVHDACPYVDQNNKPIVLKPGMVFTVEPGLYFKDLSHPYYGIGIRIEDMVVVSSNGYELLTPVPKERREIEDLMKASI